MESAVYWFFVREENRRTRRKTLEAEKRTNTNSTHLRRRVRELNPGHIAGRRAFSPLRYPCLYPGPHRVRRGVGGWMGLIPYNPDFNVIMPVHSTSYSELSLTLLRFLYLSQAFGFLSCIAFVVDMVLNYKLFQTQRAQEMPPDQGPPQRRVWDVNTEYMRSPMFYVKLAEIVSLLESALTLSLSGNFQN